jgi:hypothetical protein
VLRLRAGVGPLRPAPRARVAQRLDLSVRQVRRAERRGVRALRRICGSAPELLSAGGTITPGTVAVAERLAAVGASAGGDGTPGGTASSGSSGDPTAERDSPGGRGGVKGTSASAPFAPPPPGREGPPVIPLVLALAGLAGWFAYSRLRERYYG